MNGFIVVDKPVGISSFRALGAVKRACGTKKVGHTGTLDPLASGALPAAVGRATAFIDLLPVSGKGYSASFILGTETDTLDITGKVLRTCEVNVPDAEVIAAITLFAGKSMQVPPMYSAVKSDGQRLYKLARSGVTVERPAREIEISSIDNIFEEHGVWHFDLRCSAGTYVRSLISDIGKKLGCGAVMTALRRTYSNGFDLSSARTPDEIATALSPADIVIPVDKAFECYSAVTVTGPQARRFVNGNPLDGERLHGAKENGMYRVYSPDGTFLGIGELAGGEMTVRGNMGTEALSDSRGQIGNRKTALALGTFDGLHTGHMSVISLAKGAGEDMTPAVLLFSQHPLEVLTGSAPQTLADAGSEAALLASSGVKIVRMDFNSIRGMTPREFVAEVLVRRLNAGFAACGFNYRFGKNGEGNPGTLAEICAEYGIRTAVAAEVDYGGAPVSSTRIRDALKRGDITAANAMLGRAFSYELEVCHGSERGRLLGFPTINQRFPENFCIPAFGVYASETVVDGRTYRSLTNVGMRPTVGSDAPSSETFIEGFSGYLYGRKIRVSLLRYVRPEVKFDSLDGLKEQIGRDLREVLSFES